MPIVPSDSATSPSELVSVDEKKAIICYGTCPSCGHNFNPQDRVGINCLPLGMKFDPNDQEILEHLEAKSATDRHRLHPLINDFIPTLEGENGICYTHPEKLPGFWYVADVMNPISYVKKGMSRDGHIRHFFHRPSKAYTTGTRKRRKVHKDKNGNETRWHKTGKTRPLLICGTVKGHKKILVLYTNYGQQRKPEKTNWVMHQYHLGINKEEKDGELVLSKVFYQTQPRQFSTGTKASPIAMDCFRFQEHHLGHQRHDIVTREEIQSGSGRDDAKRLQFQLIPDSENVEGGDGCTYIQFASGASKGKLASN